jgi:hypothetical protein
VPQQSSSTVPGGGPPATVAAATVLWFAAFAVGVLSQVLPLGGTDLAGPTGAAAPAGLRLNPLVLLLLGFLATVAPRMRAGHNWARLVLTVVGAAMLVLASSALATVPVLVSAGGPGVLATLLLVGWFLLLAAAVTTMYLPASRAWFAPGR